MKFNRVLPIFVLVLLASCGNDETGKENLSLSYSISPLTTKDKHDGSIDITVRGGSMPYTFQWSTGDITEDLLNISLGEYTVKVTDSEGQSIQQRIIVDDSNLIYQPIRISYQIIPLSCLRNADGKISVSVYGGEEPYRYFWSTGDVSKDIDDLPLGTYKLTVTDNQMQSDSATIIIDNQYVIYFPPEVETDGWETAHMDDVLANSENIVEAIKTLRTNSYKIHAMLIAVDGKLIVEEYFPGFDSQGTFHAFDRYTLHEVQSTSKSYRSALIGIAIDNGFISSERTSLIELMPEYENLFCNGKEQILVEHLLTMSSGIEWNEWYGTPNFLSEMYALPYYQWFSYIFSKPLEYTPGSQFVYNTGTSIMLNQVIENSIPMDLSTFVQDYFTAKIESNYPQGFGNPLGAQTLPRDMLKFGQVFLDDGKWKDNQIISQSWIAKSFQRIFYVPEFESYYGYQWWIKNIQSGDRNFECHYTSGNGGQYIMILKELKTVIVFTGGSFNAEATKPFEIVSKSIIPDL